MTKEKMRYIFATLLPHSFCGVSRDDAAHVFSRDKGRFAVQKGEYSYPPGKSIEVKSSPESCDSGVNVTVQESRTKCNGTESVDEA